MGRWVGSATATLVIWCYCWPCLERALHLPPLIPYHITTTSIHTFTRHSPANARPTISMTSRVRQKLVRPRRWICVARSLLSLVFCGWAGRHEAGQGSFGAAGPVFPECSYGSSPAITHTHRHPHPLHASIRPSHLHACVQRCLCAVQQLAPLLQPPLNGECVAFQHRRHPCQLLRQILVQRLLCLQPAATVAARRRTCPPRCWRLQLCPIRCRCSCCSCCCFCFCWLLACLAAPLQFSLGRRLQLWCAGHWHWRRHHCGPWQCPSCRLLLQERGWLCPHAGAVCGKVRWQQLGSQRLHVLCILFQRVPRQPALAGRAAVAALGARLLLTSTLSRAQQQRHRHQLRPHPPERHTCCPLPPPGLQAAPGASPHTSGKRAGMDATQ